MSYTFNKYFTTPDYADKTFFSGARKSVFFAHLLLPHVVIAMVSVSCNNGIIKIFLKAIESKTKITERLIGQKKYYLKH